MFGGINIDPQQMMQQQAKMQELQKICAQHSECVKCPLYTLDGYNDCYCENALVRLSAQSGQTSS